ncbi:TetR/AcrR family transcriptional regulator [Oceanobacillus luteolus]|uniref:TetR/AcrR family transcriptional regulator n=1 Tax=Oceanobacillus luteolus TaxID=1274358 RepID=A0ABW4HSJ9_9BACI
MNRRQEKFNNRHKLILEKAEEIIKKQGYINFTMDEVAKAVDIAKGTLYLHFKSKEELVYNLVHPKMLQLLNDVKKIVNKETDFILKLNRLISGLFSSSYFQFVVLSFPDMSAVFQKDTSSELELIQKEIIKNFISLINSGNENNLLNGVPSGKCGFTTLSKSIEKIGSLQRLGTDFFIWLVNVPYPQLISK